MRRVAVADVQRRTGSRVRSARFLEQALLFTFVMHGAAMLSMALLLLPGMPGGGQADAARITYIAHHPWLWRLGWLPWQLTALSDLLLAVGLLRTVWIPRLPALLTLLVTVAGIVPDQMGQVLWMTRGVALAQAGNSAAYLAFEGPVFVWIAAWGGGLYTLGAIGWSISFAGAGVWNRWLTLFSVLVWGLFGFLGIAPLLPARIRPAAALVAGGNAISFVLLLIWLAVVAELVLRRSRPVERYGRLASWRYPIRGIGKIWDIVANSRFLRALCEYLPTLAFRSDITNVIYVNYVVEAARLGPLVPAGLALQRLGPDGRFATFSVLTYKHGHFGPALLGPLRMLMPSPVQSNWRIYVRDPQTGSQGVFFVATAITSTLVALGARMLAEGMPMHVLRSGQVRMDADAVFSVQLDAGSGSAPDAEATLRMADGRPASGPWSACFDSYEAMLAYCVPQDRALSSQPWRGWITRQEIALGIPLDACEPLEGEVRSHAAEALVGDATAFSFRVPRVAFFFEREEHDRRQDEGAR